MQNRDNSFSISLSNLWTYRIDNTSKRLPVKALPANGGGHIHGRLEIKVAGRLLPFLGYFDKDDVCIGEWTQVLMSAREELLSANHAEFEYDEGEQGQPMFRFVREGPSVFISIVDSPSSDQPGIPDWQQIECSFNDFITAIDSYLVLLEKMVSSLSPIGGRNWLKGNMVVNKNINRLGE
jgi:hypothetical protein